MRRLLVSAPLAVLLVKLVSGVYVGIRGQSKKECLFFLAPQGRRRFHISFLAMPQSVKRYCFIY